MSAFAMKPANSYMRPKDKCFMVFSLLLYNSKTGKWAANVCGHNNTTCS